MRSTRGITCCHFFCSAVFSMPERVTFIRVLIAELNRLSSHLVWLGTHGMEIGAVSVMLYCFREREQLLNLNEMLAGFRMFPSYLRIGGLREDCLLYTSPSPRDRQK